MNRRVWKRTIGGFTIELRQSQPVVPMDDESGEFEVRYGTLRYSGLTFRGAANEIGDCVMHAIQCEGRIQEESKS